MRRMSPPDGSRRSSPTRSQLPYVILPCSTWSRTKYTVFIANEKRDSLASRATPKRSWPESKSPSTPLFIVWKNVLDQRHFCRSWTLLRRNVRQYALKSHCQKIKRAPLHSAVRHSERVFRYFWKDSILITQTGWWRESSMLLSGRS